MNKIGTITVSVFKSDDRLSTSFKVESDNKNVEQIFYIVQDALKSY